MAMRERRFFTFSFPVTFALTSNLRCQRVRDVSPLNLKFLWLSVSSKSKARDRQTDGQTWCNTWWDEL